MLAKKQPIVPHSAIYLDITWGYMLKAFLNVVKPGDRQLLQALISNLVLSSNAPYDERMILSASVRTTFDLILQVLDLPLGSEILMTSINIPDMVKIIRHHGLIPVPVEISDDTLGPSLEDVKKGYSEKTKLLLISFLYGAKFECEAILDFAKEKKLFIIEDQAESFNTPLDNGNPKADLTLFSFGTIKPFTAYGGSIAILRNQEVVYRKAMHILEKYPVMPTSFFFKKIIKNIPVYLGLNVPLIQNIFRPMLTDINFDYKSYFVSMVRGFQPKKVFLETFRLQMPTAMMGLLFLRLNDYNQVKYQMQVKKLQQAQDQLVQNGIQVPGRACVGRSFWLYPIITDNHVLVYQILNARGIDVYLGATQLNLVESPIGNAFKYPSKTKEFFEKIIYLPIHRDVPQAYVQKVVQETIDVCKMVNQKFPKKKNNGPSL